MTGAAEPLSVFSHTFSHFMSNPIKEAPVPPFHRWRNRGPQRCRASSRGLQREPGLQAASRTPCAVGETSSPRTVPGRTQSVPHLFSCLPCDSSVVSGLTIVPLLQLRKLSPREVSHLNSEQAEE